MEIGNVIELLLVLVIGLYAYISGKKIKLLEEQNRQLAEIVTRTNKAYLTMQVKWLETFLHKQEKRREDTRDGKQRDSEFTGSTDRTD